MATKPDLNRIRENLISLEDNIILSLFVRSRFKLNKIIYSQKGVEVPGFRGSFFDFLFRGTERLHALAGRYADPEEHPFYSNPPEAIVPRKVNDVGAKKTTNFTRKVMKAYFESLSSICEPGDDNNYGSAVIADINCLQNLAQRVHIGEQVAESKFLANSREYAQLIALEDRAGIMDLLTDPAVEQKVIDRVAEKGERYNLNPEFISAFYRDRIIPLTKDVEVEYLMKRQSK